MYVKITLVLLVVFQCYKGITPSLETLKTQNRAKRKIQLISIQFDSMPPVRATMAVDEKNHTDVVSSKYWSSWRTWTSSEFEESVWF